MVGGLISTAEHGGFLSGFLSAGVGSLGGPILGEAAGTISPQGVIVSAALGGVASVLGGGKFQNGAITGAFAYVASNAAERATVTASTGTVSIPKSEWNTPTVDTSVKYATYDQAQDALKMNIEVANMLTGNHWEWGGFVVGAEGGGFYLTQLATSHNLGGIAWMPSSLEALKAAYPVYAYDHIHLQSFMVNGQETGMWFSGGDTQAHNIFAGSGTYGGTFVDWHGSTYELNGQTSYPVLFRGIQGTLCATFPQC
jgi:hypothetical protein